ncbi:MAG TPA: glycosyltransferase, partial [Thermoanaerobaculia bacterium]|nr:glycosyltransferase [Thermoanaerobaculia bacterium]
MSVLVLPAFAASVLVFWLALSLDRRRRWPAELVLPVAASDLVSEEPDGVGVVALVPARDEAELLPRTLPWLLAQEGLTGVVLVDDGSTDATTEVAHEVARGLGVTPGAAVLEVIAAGPRPPGWTGKVHAQAVGLARAGERWPDAEWLLLTDADIRLRPGALAGLFVQASRGFDLVSIMAKLRTDAFWEKLLVPAFVYFFQLLYPFRDVARAGARTAAAAGGCVLVRRAALEQAGSFEAIRTRLIDDVALAKAVAGAGGRPWLGLDPGIESVRPYPRLHDVWRMVARSAFVQLDYRWSLVVLVLVGLSLFFVSPPAVLVAGATLAAVGGESARLAGGAAVVV